MALLESQVFDFHYGMLPSTLCAKSFKVFIFTTNHGTSIILKLHLLEKRTTTASALKQDTMSVCSGPRRKWYPYRDISVNQVVVLL